MQYCWPQFVHLIGCSSLDLQSLREQGYFWVAGALSFGHPLLIWAFTWIKWVESWELATFTLTSSPGLTCRTWLHRGHWGTTFWRLSASERKHGIHHKRLYICGSRMSCAHHRRSACTCHKWRAKSPACCNQNTSNAAQYLVPVPWQYVPGCFTCVTNFS